MNVIVFVDDRNGMMFNNRRQSRDSVAIEKIMEMTNGKRLYVNTYSSKLFSEYNDIVTDDDCLELADNGEYVFVENLSLAPVADKIEKVILFKWNRVYPSDKKLDVSCETMKLELTFDFAGSSHENITCEVWSK